MNQKGFTNTILMVIIVVLLGTLVYMTFVKKSERAVVQQTTTPTQTATPVASSTQTSVSQDKNYLTIKEWGVQFEKPANMNDLQYTVSDNANVVYFSTQQLTDLDKSNGGDYCSEDHHPLGGLSRLQKTGPFANANDSSSYIPIGNYLYHLFFGPGNCSNNGQVRMLQDLQQEQISTMIEKSLKVVSDETADWQVYQNAKYGFEIKYPSNWFSRDCDSSYVGFSYSQSKLPTCFTDQNQPHININVTEVGMVGIDKYIEDTQRSIENSSKTTITLNNNVSATRFTGLVKTEEGPGPVGGIQTIQVLFSHNSNIYQVYYYGLDNKDYSQIFDQILSTFKFTN